MSSSANMRLFFGVEWETRAEKSESGYELKVVRVVPSHRKVAMLVPAISQEYAQKLDEYIKGFALTRKDFVELAIDYFLRTGFDIRGEAFDLSPLERITNRLESSVKVMEQLNEGTEAMHQLLQAVREQTAKQLPAPEIIAQATEEKVKAEKRAEEQTKELQRIQEENNRLRDEVKELQAYKEKAYRELCRIRDEQKTFGKIRINTEL